MYINKIDLIFDSILDKFNQKLLNKKFLNKISNDTNFVKFTNDIVKFTNDFINDFDQKEIFDIVKNETNTKYIINILKKYCGFYIYLGIAYYYNGNRDLFITNILESSSNKEQIDNFFTTENIGRIVNYFVIIKQIEELKEKKSLDRIKILLKNDPIKYNKSIEFFNILGEEYLEKNIFINDNLHNVIKTIIITIFYNNIDKQRLFEMINDKNNEDAEYKYIDVIVGNDDKIIDYPELEKIILSDNLPKSFALEFYEYLIEEQEADRDLIKNAHILTNFLFNNNYLIPITEEFLRFHSEKEKYKIESSDRESTKIKFIVSKFNKIINLNSAIYDKNQKLLKQVKDMFLKQLDNESVLYNDLEEIKVQQKLRDSEQTSDIDYLIDLENFRKYAYVNYKEFSRDGIRINPEKTIPAIRHHNINKKKNKYLDIRVGHPNISLNVIGVAFNPSGKPMKCMKTYDLKDVREEYNDTNGYESFNKMLKKKFDKDDTKVYYWLFNTKKDKVKLSSYRNVSSLDTSKSVKNMMAEVYNNFVELLENKFLDKITELTHHSIYDFVKEFNDKYNIFNFDELLRRKLIMKGLLKIKEIKPKIQNLDNIYNNLNKIKLPVIKDKIKNNKTIYTKNYNEEFKIDEEGDMVICHHYVKWIKILKMRDGADKNQTIFDFIKRYVMVNQQNDYVCKSCGEYVNLKKFNVEGTYIEEKDTFLTTSLAVTDDLYKIPKYSKLGRAIKNIDNIIEKTGIEYFIGSTPIIKLRRKLLVKEILDLILLHTQYLKEQPNNRHESFKNKYNINNSILFFFPLKDDIFITSSEDTDKYKKIKFNNVLIYIILLILSELNSGQIIGLKQGKRNNYFVFNKTKEILFGDLYLRVSEKDKIKISNYELLCYVLFYISSVFIEKKFFTTESDNFVQNQKTIINTFVDLFNTIFEANYKENKDYLYELLSSRILLKLNRLYKDERILSKVKEISDEKIRIDSKTKKITFVTKKIFEILLDGTYQDYNIPSKISKFCHQNIFKTPKKIYKKSMKTISAVSNCSDGKFHKWVNKNNDIVCSLCNLKFDEVLKSIDSNNNLLLKKIKLERLKKLSTKFCISGKKHDFENNKCKLCKKSNDNKYTEKELLELEKNLLEINNSKIKSYINKNKLSMKEKQEKFIYNQKKIVNFEQKYKKYTNDKLINYIDDFIDKLTKITGNKINIRDEPYFIKHTTYIISNDNFGNITRNKFTISSKENKMKYEKDNEFFKTDVLYYRDVKKSKTIYYDANTRLYLGYKDSKYHKLISNAHLHIKYSIRDMLMLLGLTYDYENIHAFNKNEQKYRNVLENIIRNRINNIKFIIYKTLSIIQSIKHQQKRKSEYKLKENELIKDLSKILKKIKMKNKEKNIIVFRNLELILNSIKLNPIKNNNKDKYIDIKEFINQNNGDAKLIFYLIYNLNKLIKVNDSIGIQSNVCLMISRIIIYCFELLFFNKDNAELRKWEYIIINDTPYMDQKIRPVGYYQELVSIDQLDEEAMKEKELDNLEEQNALDVDDYDLGEDEDALAEAMNFEP